jgi:DNA-binding response OmpR family regulator
MRVLVYEREGEFTQEALSAMRAHGHDVSVSHEVSLSSVDSDVDLVVLSLDLPSFRGWNFLKELRLSGCTIPLLAIESSGKVSDRVRALDLGADRCMKKPIDIRELVALAKVMCKRCNRKDMFELRNGTLVFETESRFFYLNEIRLHLTVTESVLLEVLMRRSGRVVHKQEMLDLIRTSRHDVCDEALHVHMYRIRNKVGKESARIESVRGVGYRMRKLSTDP